MKREILASRLFSCIVTLLPMLAWAQNNDTNSPKMYIIAVPVRNFSEFVIADLDPVNGKFNYSGFAIEVFKEIADTAVPRIVFEFEAFQNGSFDDMLRGVYNKKYDGAVGEISILAYRMDWVDFTVPYIDASTTMLVRRKQQSTSENGGLSLIGITYGIVITTFVLSFTAFLIAAIYVGISTWARCFGPKDNRGPRDRTGISLIQTRLWMITFFLLLLTLNACYIISQTSSNTFHREGGIIKNIDQLIRLGSNVGYREGSFHYTLLVSKGVSKSKLISLKNENQMAEMLSKETSNGGVDAVVANAPQLKLLQAKYCDNFTLVPTTNLPSAGFGFAFSKNTTLAREVSKGILRLIDYGGLQKIQQKTIGSLEVCEDDRNINHDNHSSFLKGDHKWILTVGAILVGLIIIVSLIYHF